MFYLLAIAVLLLFTAPALSIALFIVLGICAAIRTKF